ncbi:MAG: helix-turn-helix domain-containing protein [Actinomycetota bacterium]
MELNFSKAAGAALRRARQARGYTRKAVAEMTDGRFKPSAIGGYERGEREISLQRFCELADAYGVAPDRLLAEATEALTPRDRTEVVIDLTRLPMLEGEEEGLLHVARFVHDVRARRGDYLGDVLTLRSGDLDEIARSASMRPTSLRRILRPAMRDV